MKKEIYYANGKHYLVGTTASPYYAPEYTIKRALQNQVVGRKEGDMKVDGFDYTFSELEESDDQLELEPIAPQGYGLISVDTKPRAWTASEVAEQIVEGVVGSANYWATSPSCGTMEERVHGCAFSILSMLDGSTMQLPGIDLVPAPHDSDKDYHIENGENWYDPETVVSTSLHDMYHPKKREMLKAYEDAHPSKRMSPSEQREVFLRAAVTIANLAGEQPEGDKLEACHETAQGIISLIDGNYNEDLPPFMVFASPSKLLNQRLAANNQPIWDSSIPLNRKEPTYGLTEDLGEQYASVRTRTRKAAQEMFGK
jgi:hypothetical protein